MKPSKEVTDLAVGLIQTIGADPAFVAAVSDREIERRVTAGQLVPMDRLMIGGLELTPVGRLAALERICREVVTVWIDTLGADPGWTDEERSLNAVLKRLSGIMDGGTDEPDVAAEPSAEQPAPTAPESRPAPAPSAGPPEIGDRGPCERCGKEIVDDEQALRSWTRFRVKLCAPCQVKGPPDRAVDVAHDNEDDVADVDEEE